MSGLARLQGAEALRAPSLLLSGLLGLISRPHEHWFVPGELAVGASGFHSPVTGSLNPCILVGTATEGVDWILVIGELVADFDQ